MNVLIEVTDEIRDNLLYQMGIFNVKTVTVDNEQHIIKIKCDEGITYFLGIMRVEIK